LEGVARHEETSIHPAHAPYSSRAWTATSAPSRIAASVWSSNEQQELADDVVAYPALQTFPPIDDVVVASDECSEAVVPACDFQQEPPSEAISKR
jgi:hypothetical protein